MRMSEAIGTIIMIFFLILIFNCGGARDKFIAVLENNNKSECIDGYVYKFQNSYKYQYLENGVAVKCIEVKKEK